MSPEDAPVNSNINRDGAPSLRLLLNCNSDEMPVAGECLVVEGVGLMFSAGVQLNRDHPTGPAGYHCFYTGSPKVRAYAYCVNKK